MQPGARARRIGASTLAIVLTIGAPSAALDRAPGRQDDASSAAAATAGAPSGSARSADERSVNDPSANGPEPILPDPATFDPVSTTDTEVARMRLRLALAEIDARIIDRSATAALQWNLKRQQILRAERDTGREAVETVRSILAATAIDGFVIDTNIAVGEFFLPTLEGETTATLTGETANRLLENRATAEEALAEAEEALAEVDAAVAEARNAKTQALGVLVEAVSAVESFELRAAEQRAAGDAADAEAAAISADVSLRSVAGTLHVNAAIEADVDRLISDAREDGIDLGGGSYRTFEAQIELRLAHCGGSVPPDVVPPGPEALPEEIAAYEAAVAGWTHHVIYEVPAGACSPPTATPGNSEHQLGLAIDFTEAGAILTRSSPGFAWLVEHAEEYGLFNLPSEPWHWSTTGS